MCVLWPCTFNSVCDIGGRNVQVMMQRDTWPIAENSLERLATAKVSVYVPHPCTLQYSLSPTLYLSLCWNFQIERDE